MTQTDYGTTQPLISVITVCFNEAPDRIRKTFASIATQSYERTEWIVVDGGSMEKTLAAIREFIDAIDRMISEADRGLYDAMNKGIRLSSGQFLLFMNVGDRFLTADTVADMAKVAVSRPGYDWYYGNYVRIQDNGRVFVPMPKSFGRFEQYAQSICHQTILGRRELFEHIGGFDTSYSLLADQDWLRRGMATGAQALHTGITVCEFEAGGACSDTERMRQEWARLRRQHFRWWERGVFSFGLCALKIIRRLRTGNFAIPVGWRRIMGT